MDKKISLLFAIFGIILVASMFNTYAIFSGSHSVYKNRTTATAAIDFCIKCHPEKVSSVTAGVHKNAGCICHGYNPNSSELYNINIAHNLTKQIYCTNCHSNYTISTGNIVVHNDNGREISGINQSAHYIISSSTNKTPLYDRAKSFFNDS